MDPKSRVFGKDFVILACVVLIESESVTDIQTDRKIDRQTPLP